MVTLGLVRGVASYADLSFERDLRLGTLEAWVNGDVLRADVV